ncbi:MAG: LON peptidase substrate-binding domain-containing protein, partial [Saprospiraceae bacterium]
MEDNDIEFMPTMFPLDGGDEDMTDEIYPDTLPILALKNTVLFPNVVIPITVGRDRSIKAINKAHDSHKYVAVVSQMDMNIEMPTPDDLFKVGTVARIMKILKLPDGTITAILQGRKRLKLNEITKEEPYLEGKVSPLEDEPISDPMEMTAIVETIKEKAKEIVRLSPNIPSEAGGMLENITGHGFLINFISSNLRVDVSIKQEILTLDKLNDKAELVLKHMNNELKLLEIKGQIDNKVRGDIEKQQRDYFLNQQLKTIQEELGQTPRGKEFEEFQTKAKDKKWTTKIAERFAKEMKRLQRTNPQAAEHSVLMNWAELMLDLPWGEYSDDNFDLKNVKEVLDADHFGLEKVKKRVLEHLAVLKLRNDMKAPIICLAGPPGVGKTSLGKSIANALGRKYIRMSLGGLHDESEIRGHRKTYIGAMPGRI